MITPPDYHNVKNAEEFLSKCGYDDPNHPLHHAKANIATLMDVYHAAMKVKEQYNVGVNVTYVGSSNACPYKVGNECRSRTVTGCYDANCELNGRPRPILTAVCATCGHNPCQCHIPMTF